MSVRQPEKINPSNLQRKAQGVGDNEGRKYRTAGQPVTTELIRKQGEGVLTYYN